MGFKFFIGLGVFALLGWGFAFWGWKHPPVTPQNKTESVSSQHSETRTVYRETTRPDGTTVKETIASQSHDKETIAASTVTGSLSHWSLGLTASAPPLSLIDPRPIYGLLVGHRILETPLWIQAGLTTRREATLGLSIEW